MIPLFFLFRKRIKILNRTRALNHKKITNLIHKSFMGKTLRKTIPVHSRIFHQSAIQITHVCRDLEVVMETGGIVEYELA